MSEHAKRPSATKRGPGRYHKAVKSGGPKKFGFANGIANAAAKKRADTLAAARRACVRNGFKPVEAWK